jgi:hypothetical protein
LDGVINLMSLLLIIVQRNLLLTNLNIIGVFSYQFQDVKYMVRTLIQDIYVILTNLNYSITNSNIHSFAYIYSPILVESLIGEDGSKHRKLRNQLKVNSIYLLPGSINEAHCSIDIMDRSYSVSKNAAKSILRLLRKEYGTHLANARMEAMSACTKLEFDREE